MNIVSKTVHASIFLLVFTLMFTLSSQNVHATPIALPIINQDEFKWCIADYCQVVAPAWLDTDFNTSTNIYNITNMTNITNITNYLGANVSTITCSGTDKVSAIDNATGIVTCSADIGGVGEDDDSAYILTSNEGNLNVNNSNTSNYCSNVLGGQSCTNTTIIFQNDTYNAFNLSTNCSQFWNGDCNLTSLNDASMGCNGTQVGVLEHIKEIYINATAFHPGDAINTTCEFMEYNRSSYPRYDSEYLWYYDGNSWYTIYSNYSTFPDAGPSNVGVSRNRSFVFNVNATEGQQIIRCNINYYNKNASNFCNNNTATAYDTDDVNFTVTSGNNTTTTSCTNIIQNITANNSLYLNGYGESYFYPYSNPYNFTNSTGGNASFNQSLTDSLYAPIDEPLWSANYTDFNSSWSTTRNITYENYVNANVSSVANNSIYCYGKSEADLNTNDSSYLNHKAEANLNTNSSTYWNGINAFSGLNNQVLSNGANITSGTITNVNIAGTGWVNSSTGGKYNNNTKFYFGTEGEYCIYYNTTLQALVSTNVC